MTDMRKNNNAMRVVFNGEGCATIVLLYTYTESVEEKNMMKGKKWRRKENGEKSVAGWI